IITKQSYHLSYLALWPIFIVYYDDIFSHFNKSSKFVQIFIGACGGALAYYGAYNLGAIKITDASVANLIGFTFVFWGIFFPLSLKVYSQDVIGKILDFSVIFSFDRTGYQRHKKIYAKQFKRSIFEKKYALVTGGTSGIGFATCMELAKLNVNVETIGRNIDKGNSLQQSNPNINFEPLDLADWEAVENYSNKSIRFDFVVLNAGGMPNNKEVNKQGVELQMASQLIGHYLLIENLRKQKKLNKGCRIVWVSSGGMYLKSLDLESLLNNFNYDKVSTYANVKRAQVTLVEELSKSTVWRDFVITAMHPGWVKTAGLDEALPGFVAKFKNRLRSPEEGAATIIWLLLTESKLKRGGFYFDWHLVSPYLFGLFNPSRKQREQLLKIVYDRAL
ncbi:MAG: SDR family NAD(P)-dependent oxidoreductase, partial [Bdellovibrionales bacterium]|nr:SDR family NAD(P)-dependent oxidoreductase [Bdellovibrionales bacterium]